MGSKHYKDKGFSRGYMSSGKTVQELKLLGEDVLNAAKEALATGADEVMQEAKGRCPVYEGRDSRVVKGALRDSIHLEKKKSGTAYKISADARAKDGMYYGQIVEFSPLINRPFLYPALDAHKDAIKASIVDAIKAACGRHGK